MKGNDFRELRIAALNANNPRQRCQPGKNGDGCSCNDLPRAMHKFHKLATPSAILDLLRAIDR